MQLKDQFQTDQLTDKQSLILLHNAAVIVLQTNPAKTNETLRRSVIAVEKHSLTLLQKLEK